MSGLSNANTPCCVGRCTTVRTLLVRTSRILNDDTRDVISAGGITSQSDWVRWPAAVLVDFLNEALTQVQSLRPDAFTRTVAIPLRAGARQVLPDGYDSLIEVVANASTGPDGEPVMGEPVLEEVQKFSRKIRNAVCDTDANCVGSAPNYEVKGYSKNPEDTHDFAVMPPVPRNANKQVFARVVVEPPVHCTEELDACVGVPRKYEAQIVDWILSRAYLIETESEFSPRAASSALNRFYTSMRVNYLQESRFGSAYYLGKTPEGDQDEQANQRSR